MTQMEANIHDCKVSAMVECAIDLMITGPEELRAEVESAIARMRRYAGETCDSATIAEAEARIRSWAAGAEVKLATGGAA